MTMMTKPILALAAAAALFTSFNVLGNTGGGGAQPGPGNAIQKFCGVKENENGSDGTTTGGGASGGAGGSGETEDKCGMCDGDTFNPISDVNWNNAFPISIAGVEFGGGKNPPGLQMQTICNCPSYIYPAMQAVGISMTMWEPNYLLEVTTKPGCLHSWGGEQVLDDQVLMRGTLNKQQDGSNASYARRQIHWIAYPLYYIMGLLKTACGTQSGIAIGYLSELSEAWQSDALAAKYVNPDAALYNNFAAQLACMADAVAAQFWFPLDPLMWCGGGTDVIFPLTGNALQGENAYSTNAGMSAKAISLMHRYGMLNRTTYYYSECSALPFPNIIKTQYRIDPVYPTKVDGDPIYTGKNIEMWGYNPPPGDGFHPNSTYFIWQGTRCCLHY